MRTAIVAFAFGTPSSTVTNRRLASIAGNRALALNVQVITQRDIKIGGDIEIKIEEDPLLPAPTLRIARQAVIWAEAHQIERLMVVAALPHLARCLRDLRKAAKERGFTVEIVPDSEVLNSRYFSWFDKSSTQKRVRSLDQWIVREAILTLMPFWLYKRIAA